jgi:hypothetical protein
VSVLLLVLFINYESHAAHCAVLIEYEQPAISDLHGKYDYA